MLTTDLDHLIHVFTNEMKLSNIASIIGTGIYGTGDSMILNISRVADPGQGLCGFDWGWSLVVK